MIIIKENPLIIIREINICFNDNQWEEFRNISQKPSFVVIFKEKYRYEIPINHYEIPNVLVEYINARFLKIDVYHVIPIYDCREFHRSTNYAFPV